MDLEQINGLLMDYALGGATGEQIALIEALAEKDPAVQARLNQWKKMVQQIQHAANDAAVVLPAWPVQSFQSPAPGRWRRFLTWIWFGIPMEFAPAQRSGQWRRIIAWSVSMAACVILGFTAGHPWNAASPSRNVAYVNSAPVPAVNVSDVSPVSADDFWSVARQRAIALRQNAPQSISSNSLRNEWLQNHQL